MEQTRRRILQTGTGGIVTGLAGCSSFKRTLLGHQLAHQVTIANVRYSPLRLDLTVQDDSGKILLKNTSGSHMIMPRPVSHFVEHQRRFRWTLTGKKIKHTSGPDHNRASAREKLSQRQQSLSWPRKRTYRAIVRRLRRAELSECHSSTE